MSRTPWQNRTREMLRHLREDHGVFPETNEEGEPLGSLDLLHREDHQDPGVRGWMPLPHRHDTPDPSVTVPVGVPTWQHESMRWSPEPGEEEMGRWESLFHDRRRDRR